MAVVKRQFDIEGEYLCVSVTEEAAGKSVVTFTDTSGDGVVEISTARGLDELIGVLQDARAKWQVEPVTKREPAGEVAAKELRELLEWILEGLRLASSPSSTYAERNSIVFMLKSRIEVALKAAAAPEKLRESEVPL